MQFVIGDFSFHKEVQNPMGVTISKHSISKQKTISLSSNVSSSSQRSSVSIIESMKLECLKKRKLKKKKKRKLTLEDWLLASPGPKWSNINGGEVYVFKQFSKRVHVHHESRFREHRVVFSTPGDSFSSDHVGSGDVSGSSYKRSQSEKLKKKVSFKLPEEGDIMLFYSPAQSFETDPHSF